MIRGYGDSTQEPRVGLPAISFVGYPNTEVMAWFDCLLTARRTWSPHG
jgi:hypothetical protein